jgi:hypothetical protein
MVITILEGHVAPEKWDTLESTYREAEKAWREGSEPLSPDIVQTLLAQHATERTLWRIMTHWRSRAGLEAYRQSVETPAGVLMFRAAGTEPTLSIFDVHIHVAVQP